jgi:hypothetical protein
MFRRTGGGVIDVRAEPRPVTEPYMASAEGGPPAAVSGGRDSAGDCGRDSGLREKMSTFINGFNHKVLTYIEYRAVSGVFRTIDPPAPLHPASLSSPAPKAGGGHTRPTRRAVRGWGVNISEDARYGLASHSIIPLRVQRTSIKLKRFTYVANNIGDQDPYPARSLMQPQMRNLAIFKYKKLINFLFCYFRYF